jgi:hypothetical protein
MVNNESLNDRVMDGIAIDDMLLALLGKQEYVEMWWNSANANFKFAKPIDCDREEVYNYVSAQWK